MALLTRREGPPAKASTASGRKGASGLGGVPGALHRPLPGHVSLALPVSLLTLKFN